jgi:hypothetical protein
VRTWPVWVIAQSAGSSKIGKEIRRDRYATFSATKDLVVLGGRVSLTVTLPPVTRALSPCCIVALGLTPQGFMLAPASQALE